MLDHRVRRIKIPMLENIALAIGYVSIFWGWLDHELDDLLATLAPFEGGDISRSIVGNMDLRDKIKIAGALAFIRKPSVKWFSELKDVLDLIDNDLRTKRNRITHDVWTGTHDRILRRTRQTKFLRPQARQLVLSTIEETPVKAKEVWQLSNDIVLARVKIFTARVNYAALIRDGPAPLPTISALQGPRRARGNNPRKHGHGKPKRPLSPSRASPRSG